MDITAIIVSFGRRKYTIDCINSLHRLYPKIKILVGENGKPDKKIKKIVESIGGGYIVYPFDSGVPYVRNNLFKITKTKYVLIGDNDFYYDQEANLDKLETFLDHHSEFSIIGGRTKIFLNYSSKITIIGRKIRNKIKALEFQGYFGFDKSDNKHYFQIIKSTNLKYRKCIYSNLSYCQVDMVTNFWLGRLKDLPLYTEDQKIYYEHPDYMYSLKNKIKIAFTPEALVWHKKQNYFYWRYNKYRFRKSEEDFIEKKYGYKYKII